jgi:hypothetical protein
MTLRFCRLARRTPSRGKRVVYRRWCTAKLDRIMAENVYYGEKKAFVNKCLAGEPPLTPGQAASKTNRFAPATAYRLLPLENQ